MDEAVICWIGGLKLEELRHLVKSIFHKTRDVTARKILYTDFQSVISSVSTLKALARSTDVYLT